MFPARRPLARLTTTDLPLRLLACAALPLLAACRAPAPPAPPATAVVVSARPAHWGYSGREGPTHWAELSPAYAACAKDQQSPIDLTTASRPSASWSTDYRTTSVTIAHHEHVTDILDNGHTIQVTVAEGSTLRTDRGAYALKQFHFHAPSEHTVGGKSFPLEIHFVHQAAEGGFAVLSVLVEAGTANADLATLIANLPPAKGDVHTPPDVVLDLGRHLPPESGAMNYIGSFTTPPCTQDVEWLVLTKPLTASPEQLGTFATRLHANNRPIQSLNGRGIAQGKLERSITP